MDEVKVGKEYLFFGMPLWVRGVVESESVRYVWITAKTAEYMPDAQTISAYISGEVHGEKLNKRTGVPKDGLSLIIEL